MNTISHRKFQQLSLTKFNKAENLSPEAQVAHKIVSKMRANLDQVAFQDNTSVTSTLSEETLRSILRSSWTPPAIWCSSRFSLS
jgi:uncharacterized protein YbaP (TraB family)